MSKLKLSQFLPSRFRREAPAIPEGRRVYAVGDIHGRLDLLDMVIGEIGRDDEGRGEADTLLIFLGDLVDRGPDSRGVVQRLMELRASGIAARFLLGNHDELFLKAASGDAKATRFLIRNGGEETFLSYGIRVGDYPSQNWEELAAMLAASVPPEHLAFLETFEDRVEVGDYLFVHAGIRPGVPIEEQSPEDLRWIRTAFLESRRAHPRMIVHGHSISMDVEIRPNRIGIDTGAFASGRLTAIGLEGTERWIIEAVGAPDPRWAGKA